MRDEKGRFVKGYSGNPGGRTKEQLTARQAFDKAIKTSDMRKLAKKLMTLAMSGNLDAIKMILEYKIGKPTQSFAIEGTAGVAIADALDRIWPDEET